MILERFTSNWRSVAFAGGMAPPNQRTEFLDLVNSPINFATPKMTHYCLPPSPKALVKFSVERRRPRRAVTAAAARFARPDTLQTTMRPTAPRSRGKYSELAQHANIIPQCFMADDLAVPQGHHVDLFDVNFAPGGGITWSGSPP